MKFFSRLSLLVSAALFLGQFVEAVPRAPRARQSAPRWVAYWDAWVSNEDGPPAPSVFKGFNTIILAFLLSSGPADQALEWVDIGAATQEIVCSQHAADGIVILVSVFGSTEEPTTSGLDPRDTAHTMAAWVKTNHLDGIDVDYEDFDAIDAADGSAEAWLISFTKVLREALPAPQYLITHAPIAPWFSSIYTAGAYTKVNKEVGSLIDWYNVQFYNQGTSEYTTCAGLLTGSSSTYPDSAVFQIHYVAKVPLSKIVIGKPATAADATDGYIHPATLSTCLQKAQKSGWTAGVMVWQYPSAGSSWISTVRSDSWPVGSA